ncbi:GNAT family N-acetyltransferase [Staphylococcus saccharolyticus]|uniref:GNAT family N-acetyltransferase n=1 Tax=Staphylococcus saccharolyticus TaxID=33028 RepID=UPI00102DEDA9|nr:GNAT family N-acetyltransferase [Staphylococcus saccharolyticus]MBL7572620.1 GNAT family N-acetyltransferase [Staphylococcus saccharolyticus]MBL7584799.1 GNAT family N-acetyltransferase [Staphylococcus saccharolyticus]MBL7638236.1 GNAT family N-acetyltransferase [Staphylococcus saccharolyticus]QRJ68251.1 GNAT family N-acetyltransferase [Staphylococcus saccharolyticus]TAA93162.1 GNAT family N-acetyltransferase [Staphylococcus saccharolyticus]
MYSVRQATQNDVVAIRDVATKAWYNTYLNIYPASTVNELLAASYNETRFRKRLTEQLFLVVEEVGEIVSFANFIYGEELYLSAHYVRPESQHKGYGTSLLEEGLKRFKERYDTVYLEVDNKNRHGIDYYKDHGFTILRSYQPKMYGETMDLALMKKIF